MTRIRFDGGPSGHSRFGEEIDAPFLIVDDRSSRANEYPHVFYARPKEDLSSDASVWRITGVYPNPYCEDEGGWEALRQGSWYYDRGMSYTEQRQERIDCFRAAEILYLHSAEKGNVQALINLGYVYSYNRCEGRFWPGWAKYDAGDFSGYPIDERAYEVLLRAADYDFSEACYKLGDMLSAGRGCQQDYDRAFACYEKAYSLSKFEDPVIAGSCAFRLAKSFEEGRGCQQSFERALHFYREAETKLEWAVSIGESYYRGILRKAKSGVVRMRREISGQY